MTVAPEVLQVSSELARMVALYRERKPMRVLEIGVWQGGTLREWIRHAPPGARIVAVDLRHENWRSYQEWHRADVECVCHSGSSRDPAVQAKIRDGAPFDWVFIDGDHSAEGVRADVELVLPLMAPGGALLLHDIVPPTGESSYPPGVLLEELREVWAAQWEAGLRSYGIHLIVDLEPQPVAHGIGVVFVP